MARSKADILQTSRQREEHKKWLRRFFGLLIILIIVGGTLFLLNLSFLRVTNITISGQTSVELDTIKQSITDRFAGRYLGLVPKDSLFFIMKTVLINDLKRQFPSLAEVKIIWPDLNTLSVQVVDRDSQILWCVGPATNKQCYFVDTTGQLFQEAPNFSSSLMIELQSSRPTAQIKERVITQKNLARTITVINFVRDNLKLWPTAGLSILRTEVKAQNDFVIILTKEADSTWQAKILFNDDQSASDTITNLHSVLKNDQFIKEWQQASGNLDYLDLRFPGKVFYKFI